MTLLTIEEIDDIRQSPRAFVDIQTVEVLSDTAMVQDMQLKMLRLEIKQLTEERDEFMGYAKDGTVIAAQQLMEINSLKTDRDRLRAALEKLLHLDDTSYLTQNWGLSSEQIKVIEAALKGQP